MKQSENKNYPRATPVTLGEYIRQVREGREMSARKLSEELHMHPSYISRVEAGNLKQPSPEKLQRIAEHLGLDYDDLCALAGYQAPGLPDFLPYLRAKYDMNDDDARRLGEYFEFLRNQHGITKRSASANDRLAHVS
jgi:transcriptional regulator with XRE-family HTH domain